MKIPKARKLPSGSWFIQLRLQGESISVTAATEAKCQAKALAIKSGLKEAPVKRGTLRSAMNDYIRRKRSTLSPATIRGYVSIRDTHFQAYMDKDMTTVNWQKAVDGLTCSPKTARNIWNFAAAAMAEKDFTPKVTLPRAPKTDMKWLTPEQIPAFLAEIKGRPCELAALLGLHSLRRSEMFAVTAADVDLENQILHVRGSVVLDEHNTPVSKDTNKTPGSTRDVPIMIPRLYELLQDLKDHKGPLLTGHIGKPYEGINAACRRLGFPEVGVHGLRRSFASLARSIGMDITETMSIGGWSDYETIHKFYIYLSDLDRKKAANKMSQFYALSSQNANEDC